MRAEQTQRPARLGQGGMELSCTYSWPLPGGDRVRPREFPLTLGGDMGGQPFARPSAFGQDGGKATEFHRLQRPGLSGERPGQRLGEVHRPITDA